MVTRPILLHVFDCGRKARTNGSNGTAPYVSEGARKIAQTCVQCSRHSFRLLSELWIEGGFAIFDYFYTQYLFSAATILAVSALSDIGAERNDADDFETAIQMLSQLAQSGNTGAKEFCLHIDAIKISMATTSSSVREDLSDRSTAPNDTNATQQALDPYMSQAMTTGMALTEPTLQQILAQPEPNFQLTNPADLGEIQTPFWPDLWVGNWLNA
jgi:proline utilization trans-activator